MQKIENLEITPRIDAQTLLNKLNEIVEWINDRELEWAVQVMSKSGTEEK